MIRAVNFLSMGSARKVERGGDTHDRKRPLEVGGVG